MVRTCLPGFQRPWTSWGHGPSPRNMTISPDDRVDASNYFDGVRRLYEQARRYPNCDHGFFQEAFILAVEWGAG